MKRLLKGEEPYGVWRPSKYKPVGLRWRRVPVIPVEEATGQEEGQGWLFEEDDPEGTIRAVH